MAQEYHFAQELAKCKSHAPRRNITQDISKLMENPILLYMTEFQLFGITLRAFSDCLSYLLRHLRIHTKIERIHALIYIKHNFHCPSFGARYSLIGHLPHTPPALLRSKGPRETKQSPLFKHHKM